MAALVYERENCLGELKTKQRFCETEAAGENSD